MTTRQTEAAPTPEHPQAIQPQEQTIDSPREVSGGARLELRRGDRFLHRHWLNCADNSPLLCLVTRVAQGWIYYRPDYGMHEDGTPWLGSATKFDVDQIKRYVQEIAPCP